MIVRRMLIAQTNLDLSLVNVNLDTRGMGRPAKVSHSIMLSGLLIYSLVFKSIDVVFKSGYQRAVCDHLQNPFNIVLMQ